MGWSGGWEAEEVQGAIRRDLLDTLTLRGPASSRISCSYYPTASASAFSLFLPSVTLKNSASTSPSPSPPS